MTDKYSLHPKTLLRRNRGRVFLGTLCGTLFSVAGRFVFSPLLPRIIEQLEISASRAGIALSVMWASFALSQYPAGRYSDRLSRKVVIVAGLGLQILSAGLLIVWSTYVGFVLGAGLYGLGGGLYFPSSLAKLSDLFDGRKGQVFSINEAFINAGGLLATGLAIGTIGVVAWRFAFLPIAVGLVVVLLVFHWWGSESYAVKHIPLNAGTTALRIYGTPRLRWTLLAATSFMFVYQGAMSFLPTFLHSVKGFSVEFAGLSFALVFAVGFFVNPLVGTLSRWLSWSSVGALAALVGVVGLTCLVIAQLFSVSVAAVFVFAVGLTAFWPAVNTIVLDVADEQSRGGDVGAFNTVYIAVGGLGPAYVGFVAEATSYVTAFVSLLGFALVSVGLMAYLSRIRACSAR